MSGTPATLPPQPVLTKGRERKKRPEPRLASGEEVPVESPVHALYQELARIDEVAGEIDLPEPKAPGWVRLTLPLALSFMLWISIWRLVAIFW